MKTRPINLPQQVVQRLIAEVTCHDQPLESGGYDTVWQWSVQLVHQHVKLQVTRYSMHTTNIPVLVKLNGEPGS